ncbi:hypothetical protein chiPu_0022439 [Chiloscyllium punctatum]|uniref:Reverse transcriptase domain-containing protein n=1 Tax=Chiloscyllium punctatum TaxID=137246 RepID=A0A401REJ8_CHIPU|nr:hypothetical protein [Chiloscyllium punctatum]
MANTENSGWVGNRENNRPAWLLLAAPCAKCTSHIRTRRSVSIQTDETIVITPVKLSLGIHKVACNIPSINDEIRSIGLVEEEAPLQPSLINTKTYFNSNFTGPIDFSRDGEPERNKERNESSIIYPINRENQKIEIVINYPIDNFNCPYCNIIYNTIGQYRKHLKICKGIKSIRVRCNKCKWEGNYHAVACHYAKCNININENDNENNESNNLMRKEDGETENPVQCEVCQAKFKTTRGLGQHERHAHPLLRNEKRKIGVKKGKVKEVDPEKVRKGIWSITEVAEVQRLEIEFKGCKNINKRMAERIITKTAKQISDKRRLLKSKTIGEAVALDQVIIPDTLGSEEEKEEENREMEKEGMIDKTPDKNTQKDSNSLEIRNYDNKSIDELIQIIEAGLDKEKGNFKDYDIIMDKIMLKLGPNKNKISLDNKRRRKTILKSKPNDSGQSKNSKENNAKKRFSKKKGHYKETQVLYNSNRRYLARTLMGAPSKNECPLNKEDLENYYKSRLANINEKNNLKGFAKYTKSNENSGDEILMGPVTVEDVLHAIKAMDIETAAGPDRMTLKEITKLFNKNNGILPKIYSIWIRSGKIPLNMKLSRTVLIPKVNNEDELKEINNWRPITIGPIMLRLFTKIIAGRLNKVVNLNKRQKGFMSGVAGCEENIKILENIIKGSKKNKKNLAVVFVDLAKAFDSVGHKLILTALRRLQIPSSFIKLIANLYENNFTQIEGSKCKTDPIEILRGVKQGDALSPILFNIVMDPLITSIEDKRQGIFLGQDGKSFHCATLAFADDIALISESSEGMIGNLKLIEKFCLNTGLEVNINKTKGFNFVFKNKTFIYNESANWKFNDSFIQCIEPGQTDKYLGAKIDPWIGVSMADWETQLANWISNLKSSFLKPSQKIEILKTYFIPRLFYYLTLSESSGNYLKKLDLTIKGAIKDILHLPHSITDGIIYAKVRDGGLAFTKLGVFIPISIMRKYERLHQSKDEILHASFRFMGESALEKMKTMSKLKILESIRKPDINREERESDSPRDDSNEVMEELSNINYKSWRAMEVDKWIALPCQGAGAHYYKNDTISNSWLKRMRFMKTAKVINSILLRTNLFPTRASLSYGRSFNTKECRRCNITSETLAHISGWCPYVKNMRIKRHNRVVEELTKYVKKYGWMTFMEPRIKDNTGKLWIPDLIFKKDDQIVVVDVTVRGDFQINSLEAAWEEKVNKYKHLTGEIMDFTGRGKITFYGFVIGCRGKWLGRNDEFMKKLGIAKFKSFAQDITNLVISLTLELLRIFMDS